MATVSQTTAGSYTWRCPLGVHAVKSTIAVENVASGENASGATLTVAITVAGTNNIVIVMVDEYLAGGTQVASMTIGGSAATLLSRREAGDNRSEIWYRLNVSSGSQDIVVTKGSSSAECVLSAICLSGVHQVKPFGTVPTPTQGNSGNPSITVSGETDDLVVSGVQYYNDTLSAGSGESVQQDNNNGASSASTAILTEAGASSVTVNPTLAGGSSAWQQLGVSVKPYRSRGAQVRCWGGGGAGGGTTTDTTSKGGGASGGQFSVNENYPVSPGTHYSYTVAATKAGTTGSGTAGNDSTFATTGVVAKGGAPGGAYHVDGGTAGQGSTTNGVGDVVYAGGNGSAGGASATGGAGGGGAGTGGAGGNASGNTAGSGTATGGGNGGAGRTTAGNGNAGTQAGGGGGGGYATGTTNRNGGTGAAGRVDITWTEPHITMFLWGVQ